jgi:2-isopropylmalate synthase
MSAFDHRKYKPYAPIQLRDRTWPDRVTDRRAALVQRRSARRQPGADRADERDAKKLQLFQQLVKVGFKEIEIGFPAASQPDFDFVRRLIEERIPDDVTVQVLTQAREELIARSFEALAGVKRAIVHLYNSTSTVQREQVFELDRAGHQGHRREGRAVGEGAAPRVIPAPSGYSSIRPRASPAPSSISPSRSATRWSRSGNRRRPEPCIFNLPSTVEMATPNVYADQIEWFCRHVKHRDAVIISLHTHNDRGCAVAAAELATMAGADRVEGTLLGNGERTGNMDIVTMA